MTETLLVSSRAGFDPATHAEPAVLPPVSMDARVKPAHDRGRMFQDGWFVGKVGLVDQNWNTTGYLSGAAAKVVSAIGVFVSLIFFFYPGCVIATLVWWI